MTLERHGVGVPREHDLSGCRFAHDERLFDLGMWMTTKTISDGVSDGAFVAGLRRNVDQPGEGLGEIGHPGKVTAIATLSVVPPTAAEPVRAAGIATYSGEKILDVWYPDPQSTDTSLLAGLEGTDQTRRVDTRLLETSIADLSIPPDGPADAYLRLHLLSHRIFKPHEINVDGIFGALHNVVWTTEGPCDVDGFAETRARLIAGDRRPSVTSVDKFPRMTDYVIPPGVRVADADRVRLGAYLGEGTTVMHEGFVNFNAGTLGTSMVEGRISSGVVVGHGTDVGGSASIMGTLSGGGSETISIGEHCLLGANSGIGISLGDDCVVEAGLYVTAGTVITLPDSQTVKGREMSGVDNMLFRRNSVTGTVEALPRSGSWGGLNDALHKN